MARIGGQLRVAGMGEVIGVDAVAALELARALGHDPAATAEFLQAIEAGIMAAIARARGGDHD